MTSVELLRRRAHIVAGIRRFFDERGYLAVETPQLAATPIPESHLELFQTALAGPEYEPQPSSTPLYLLPSPEYYLKQLLARGAGNLYEITHSFRNREQRGPHHNPEFTMLEYYTLEADSDVSLKLTQALLSELGVREEPEVLTVNEAFQRFAGTDLKATLIDTERGDRPHVLERDNPAGLAKALQRRGMTVGPLETWEDLFQRAFLTLVEPELPVDRPVFLTHYPAAIPTLARTVPGTPWADRWELYLNGLEIANCFGEETDPAAIRSFFAEEQRRKHSFGHRQHPVDTSFLGGPETLPQCSGVAMGVDRLVMAVLGVDDIRQVISFPISGIVASRE